MVQQDCCRCCMFMAAMCRSGQPHQRVEILLSWVFGSLNGILIGVVRAGRCSLSGVRAWTPSHALTRPEK